ncbi:MAG: NIPSNAP family protein [Bacteroidota bacterium]
MMKKNILIVLLVMMASPMFLLAQAKKQQGEYYQVTVYHFTNAEQADLLDTYLSISYLPALHRQQVKSVGVFTPIANDTATDKRCYIIFPLRRAGSVEDIEQKLDKDAAYQASGRTFMDAAYDKPAFTRKEVILLKSFPLAPSMIVPKLQSPVADRVYELRSYESASEKIFRNKVQMFNEGDEIGLFNRLKFNAVFYASVIAGSRMPNLMYMTSFENMAERDAHWKAFGSDPQWKVLSAKPEYQHNVSRNETILMRARPYSDY